MSSESAVTASQTERFVAEVKQAAGLDATSIVSRVSINRTGSLPKSAGIFGSNRHSRRLRDNGYEVKVTYVRPSGSSTAKSSRSAPADMNASTDPTHSPPTAPDRGDGELSKSAPSASSSTAAPPFHSDDEDVVTHKPGPPVVAVLSSDGIECSNLFDRISGALFNLRVRSETSLMIIGRYAKEVASFAAMGHPVFKTVLYFEDGDVYHRRNPDPPEQLKRGHIELRGISYDEVFRNNAVNDLMMEKAMMSMKGKLVVVLVTNVGPVNRRYQLMREWFGESSNYAIRSNLLSDSMHGFAHHDTILPIEDSEKSYGLYWSLSTTDVHRVEFKKSTPYLSAELVCSACGIEVDASAYAGVDLSNARILCSDSEHDDSTYSDQSSDSD